MCFRIQTQLKHSIAYIIYAMSSVLSAAVLCFNSDHHSESRLDALLLHRIHYSPSSYCLHCVSSSICFIQLKPSYYCYSFNLRSTVVQLSTIVTQPPGPAKAVPHTKEVELIRIRAALIALLDLSASKVSRRYLKIAEFSV